MRCLCGEVLTALHFNHGTKFVINVIYLTMIISHSLSISASKSWRVSSSAQKFSGMSPKLNFLNIRSSALLFTPCYVADPKLRKSISAK